MAITELPLPSEPIEIETRKAIVTSKSNGGIRVSLRKSKPFRFPILSFGSREQSEKDDVFEFWDAHFPKKSFLWKNDDAGISEQPFLFDSFFKAQPAYYDLWNYTFTLKSVNSVVYSPVDPELPVTPEWGHEIQYEKEYMASDSPGQRRKSEAKSQSRRAFKLGYRDLDLSNLLTIENFWCYHFPGKIINLNLDLTSNDLHLDGDFKITSNLKWSATAINIPTCEFEILEV